MAEEHGVYSEYERKEWRNEDEAEAFPLCPAELNRIELGISAALADTKDIKEYIDTSIKYIDISVTVNGSSTYEVGVIDGFNAEKYSTFFYKTMVGGGYGYGHWAMEFGKLNEYLPLSDPLHCLCVSSDGRVTLKNDNSNSFSFKTSLLLIPCKKISLP